MVSDMFLICVGSIYVLILVLMEYGLGQQQMRSCVTTLICLNPCFNGIWSRTNLYATVWKTAASSLNPCFNGIWSRTPANRRSLPRLPVLILVLMEFKWNIGRRPSIQYAKVCLNPCFNGIWSRTGKAAKEWIAFQNS